MGFFEFWNSSAPAMQISANGHLPTTSEVISTQTQVQGQLNQHQGQFVVLTHQQSPREIELLQEVVELKQTIQTMYVNNNTKATEQLIAVEKLM